MTGLVAQGVSAGGDGLEALALALVVAVIYLFVIRLLDLNEKEPVWALVLFLQQGFIAGFVLPLVVSGKTLELNDIGGPFLEAFAIFLAAAVGFGFVNVVSRARGWTEINGYMDGIVYGATAGLGYAVGETLAREITISGSAIAEATGTGTTIWTTALEGLAFGLFGAIIGLGFAIGIRSRSGAAAIIAPLLGLVGAAAAQVLYDELREGGAVGGSMARTWLALFLPLAFVVGVMIVSLLREKRAIRELEAERESGAVTDEDLTLLRSFSGRRAKYAGAFFKGDFDGWLALRELHNRQVELAVAKQHASHESDAERRQEAEVELDRIRASIAQMRPELERVWGRTAPRGEAS